MLKRLVTGLMLSLALAVSALAADFPTKPIQIVVPWPPGGGSDMSARILGDAVQSRNIMPHPMIVSNITGAAGLNAANNVLKAKPDGYTLLWEHPSNLSMAPIIAKSTFRWNDFVLCGALGYSEVGLFVSAKSPWNTVQDLVDHIRANPKKVRWALSMNTTGHYQFMRISDSLGGLDCILLSLQGDKPKLVSVIGGNSEVASAAVAAIDPYIKSGDVRLLAVMSNKRSEFYPDVPTLLELGIDCEIEFWYTALAPKNTPDDIRDAIANAMKLTDEDEVGVEKLRQQFIVADYKSPEEITAIWQRTAQSVEETLAKHK